MAGAENVKIKEFTNDLKNVINKYILASSDLGVKPVKSYIWVNENPHEVPGWRADGAPEVNPKSDQVALEIRHVYLREVAGKFQR